MFSDYDKEQSKAVNNNACWEKITQLNVAEFDDLNCGWSFVHGIHAIVNFHNGLLALQDKLLT
jgi:hypothetical protein